jgi:hypothetical protein
MQELFVFWGPVLAAAIPLALIARCIVRQVKETRELNERIRRPVDCCGAGCICGGENLRARQQIVVHMGQPNYQQQPQVIYIQTPQQQPAPPQSPQIVYLQAPQQPQPQPMCLPAPQDQRQVRYLPAPQMAYQPDPPIYASQWHPQQAPQSYYPGPAPIVEEYKTDYPHQQTAPQLPPARVQYLPPALVNVANEVRRRLEDWELEMELQRRRK